MCGSSPNYSRQARRLEEQRQGLINQGVTSINQAFAGFDPAFYQQRQQAYIDYAMPQLAQQYRQTRGQIDYGLANRGLFGSSQNQGQMSELERAMGVNRQAIVDQGIGQAQDLQNQVLNQRGTLLNQLYASANPTEVAQNATAAAASMQQPSVYKPIGNMFTDLINQYYISQLLNPNRVSGYPSGNQYTYTGSALPQNR